MRRRLLLVIVAPIVALGVLGYQLFAESDRQVDFAESTSRITEILVEIAALDDSLGDEALLATNLVAAQAQTTPSEFAQISKKTDDAFLRLELAIQQDPKAVRVFNDVLPVVRDSVRASNEVPADFISALQIADRYSTSRHELLNAATTYTAYDKPLADSEVIALIALIEARSGHLDERLTVDIALQFDRWTPAQAGTVGAAIASQQNFLALADAMSARDIPHPTEDLAMFRRGLTASTESMVLGRSQDQWHAASDQWRDSLRIAVLDQSDALVKRAQSAEESASDKRLFTLAGVAAALVASLAIASALSERLVRRVRRISDAASGLTFGSHPATEIGDRRGDEIGALAQSFDKMSARVKRASDARDVEASVLEQIATGAPLAEILAACSTLLAPGWTFRLDNRANNRARVRMNEVDNDAPEPKVILIDRDGRVHAILHELEHAPSAEHRLACSLAQTAVRRTVDLDRLRERATRDPLTGLLNRRAIVAGLSERSYGGEPSVIYLDLDHFKHVNDEHGHERGDAMLRNVATELSKVALQHNGLVGRLGGDEFLLVVDADDDDQLTEIALQIRDALALLAESIGTAVSASIGCTRSNGFQSPEDLMAESDAAMYRAKASGRNGVVVADLSLRREIVASRELDEQLLEPSNTDGFELHFQPIWAADETTPVAFEALTRWRNEHGERVPPTQIFAVAERLGVAPKLDAEILRAVLRQIVDWKNAGWNVPPVSVNVSAQTVSSSAWVASVIDAVAAAGVSPQSIVLELTESALIADLKVAGERLQRLRDTGIKIAIDDFGSGYSSLGYLSQLPIDILKIDRRFIDRIDVNFANQAIVQSVGALATKLGISAVIEGIERTEELRTVSQLTTALLQGYLLGRPIPAHEVTPLLAGPVAPTPALLAASV